MENLTVPLHTYPNIFEIITAALTNKIIPAPLPVAKGQFFSGNNKQMLKQIIRGGFPFVSRVYRRDCC
jgi:hypothetical protein